LILMPLSFVTAYSPGIVNHQGYGSGAKFLLFRAKKG
jgi:hypothetical protein